MKVLVVGSGGREHAIVRKLWQDAAKKAEAGSVVLYAAPGNPGMAEWATCVSIQADDIDGLLRFAKEEYIDLTVVGPEMPLSLGIVDRFAKAGLRAFGPSAAAARMESSKAYAKEEMKQAGVPTPAYEKFSDAQSALNYVSTLQPPIVIKADGLAAGKGVVIAKSHAEAQQAIAEIMTDKAFGAAGDVVVIEQFLQGDELSVMAFVDASGFQMMPAIQDHKAVYDYDEGPNTGGMGTFTPVKIAAKAVMDKVRDEVFARIVKRFAESGVTYRGVLYAGLMVCDGQPYVIEFNARFGDPETQIALELLETDLLDVVETVLSDRIAATKLCWSTDAAVCVVLAAEGYPGSYRKGDVIEGLAQLQSMMGVHVLQAGTSSLSGGEVATSGGRVLNVVGRGVTMEEARKRAYAGVECISFQGKHYRRDIGMRGQRPSER